MFCFTSSLVVILVILVHTSLNKPKLFIRYAYFTENKSNGKDHLISALESFAIRNF